MNYESLVGTYNLSRNTRNAGRWTALEWLTLHEAYELSGWDLTPCQWQSWQVEDALAGLVPQWTDDGPIPSRRKTAEEIEASFGTIVDRSDSSRPPRYEIESEPARKPYYVDPERGDDANDGLTVGTAFRTVAKERRT